MSIEGSKQMPRAIVVIYDGFDMLDISGPYAFFSAAGLDPVLAGVEQRAYKSGEGVEYIAQSSFAKLDDAIEGDYVLWIPGGLGPDFSGQFHEGNPLFKWLKKLSESAMLNCAVCVGAHIAAASGMLDNCAVTTHWAFKDSLALFNLNVIPGYPRFHYDVEHNVMTGGGVSSGLDEVLKVISMVTNDDIAMSAQLLNQYAPVPPFNAGTPDTAPTGVYNSTMKIVEPGVLDLDRAIASFLKNAST